MNLLEKARNTTSAGKRKQPESALRGAALQKANRATAVGRAADQAPRSKKRRLITAQIAEPPTETANIQATDALSRPPEGRRRVLKRNIFEAELVVPPAQTRSTPAERGQAEARQPPSKRQRRSSGEITDYDVGLHAKSCHAFGLTYARSTFLVIARFLDSHHMPADGWICLGYDLDEHLILQNSLLSALSIAY